MTLSNTPPGMSRRDLMHVGEIDWDDHDPDADEPDEKPEPDEEPDTFGMDDRDDMDGWWPEP